MRKLTTRRWAKVAVPFVTLALVAAACGGDDDDDAASDTTTAEGTTAAEETDAARGDDGREDRRRPPPSPPPPSRPAPSRTVPAEIATDFGVTDDTIRIGLNADLSGIFAPLVTQIVDGQEAYWEIVNDNGGIAGRQVELVVLDNGVRRAEAPRELRGDVGRERRRRRDVQPVDRFAAHRGHGRSAGRGQPARDPAVVVLGLGRSDDR